jgi:hypothetical protein
VVAAITLALKVDSVGEREKKRSRKEKEESGKKKEKEKNNEREEKKEVGKIKRKKEEEKEEEEKKNQTDLTTQHTSFLPTLPVPRPHYHPHLLAQPYSLPHISYYLAHQQ